MAEELSFETELLTWVNREPFEPFTLVVASGDRFEINDDVQVSVGTATVQIFSRSAEVTVVRKNQMVALIKTS
jgi:hypothetical protein